MKKLLIGILTIMIICFTFAGCGQGNANKTESTQSESAIEEKKDTKPQIGKPVVIGDYTFYTESWHRVRSEDGEDGEGYALQLYFDQNSEPFDFDEYDWMYNPLKFKLEFDEDLYMVKNTLSAADEDSGHQGQFSFLYQIPSGQDLPQGATLINENTDGAVMLDLSKVPVLEE